MDQKLAAYRRKKEKEKQLQCINIKMKQFFNSFFTRQKAELSNPEIQEELLSSADNFPNEEDEDENNDIKCCTSGDIIFYCLCFLLWCIIYAIFIELQFGTVFVVVSAIIFMYINTRTGPKKSNEISAYSVFNKNCESIDGTLKAEQFEREIRYGSGSVR